MMINTDNLIERVCPRCKGHKRIRGQQGNRYRGEDYQLPNYKKIEDGVCFLCDGSGKALFTKDLSKVLKEKNGAWLEYSPVNGKYIGMIEACSQHEMDFWQPLFEASECIELKDIDDEELGRVKSWAANVVDSYDFDDDDYDGYIHTVSDLEDWCNLPEGVGLFDDDR